MTKTHAEKTGNGRGRKAAAAAEIVAPPRESAAKFETGRDAFERIASDRVNRIINRLNGLSRMAGGRSKYNYTDRDVEHIRKALIEGVNAACDRLRRQPAQGGFCFDRGDE